MRISQQQPLNVGVIKGIVRLASNDYSKASESILQIGRLAGHNSGDWVFLYEKLCNGAVMIRIIRLAKNDEFETDDSISKINSILKIK